MLNWCTWSRYHTRRFGPRRSTPAGATRATPTIVIECVTVAPTEKTAPLHAPCSWTWPPSPAESTASWTFRHGLGCDPHGFSKPSGDACTISIGAGEHGNSSDAMPRVGSAADSHRAAICRAILWRDGDLGSTRAGSRSQSCDASTFSSWPSTSMEKKSMPFALAVCGAACRMVRIGTHSTGAVAAAAAALAAAGAVPESSTACILRSRGSPSRPLRSLVPNA